MRVESKDLIDSHGLPLDTLLAPTNLSHYCLNIDTYTHVKIAKLLPVRGDQMHHGRVS